MREILMKGRTDLHASIGAGFDRALCVRGRVLVSSVDQNEGEDQRHRGAKGMPALVGRFSAEIGDDCSRLALHGEHVVSI